MEKNPNFCFSKGVTVLGAPFTSVHTVSTNANDEQAIHNGDEYTLLHDAHFNVCVVYAFSLRRVAVVLCIYGTFVSIYTHQYIHNVRYYVGRFDVFVVVHFLIRASFDSILLL